MKKFESIRVANNEESKEIKKIFDNQTNLLKGLMVIAVLQYLILFAIL